MNFINFIKGLFGVKPRAKQFESRTTLSLEVFQKTIKELEEINKEAEVLRAHHEAVLVDSQNEIKSVDSIVQKNNKVISKINEIIN